jgi:hypothetical protein
MRTQQAPGYAVPRRASAVPPQYTMQRQPMYADTDDDDDLYDYPQTTTGRSVVVRKRPLPHAPPPKQQPVQRQRGHPMVFIGLILVCGSLMFFVISFIGAEWQYASDSFKYGYPRAYQVDANVGHGDSTHPLSHFVAINTHGDIEVIEITGDPRKPHSYLYVIARISSDNADLYPVTLAFVDVAGNGKLDMEVIVNGTIYVLYNTGTTFKENTGE